MLRMLLPVLFLSLLAVPGAAQKARLAVTVFDQKTGEPLLGLEADNFRVLDDKTRLRVERAEYKQEPLDVMVLIDTSLVGEMVRPLGGAFVQNLREGEQMAIVAYDEAAELIQDFTSSQQLLLRALDSVEYGNNPRVLDALYAAIDGGFQTSAGRRVILLLSAGVEGFSRTSDAEVLKLARLRNVAIYPVYVVGAEKRMFRHLAQRTGGAFFGAKRLKLRPDALSDLVYSVARGYYELEVSGVYTLGRRIQISIEGLPKSKKKIRASARPIE